MYGKYIIPTLMLLSALMLSVIGAYYSISGLTTIFHGGMIGFICLEFCKVISTISLHRYWVEYNKVVKSYLVFSVIILSAITSMGTFGYLSKASSDKSSNVEVNSSKMIFLESAIEREKEKLNQNLNQIDTYNQTISKLITDNPAKASLERRRLQRDIATISEENKKISESIDTLSKELIPYKVEISKHEVEIGPLIYLTKLMYGDEYNKHSSTVLSYLIIIIVLVFDPLAIVLLIASQISFESMTKKDEPKVREEVVVEEYQSDDSPAIGEVIVPRNKVRASQM